MVMRVSRLAVAALFLALFSTVLDAPLNAQQMPDPKEIAGIPLPVGDVPSGTVVVRVIRGSLSNNIADQAVQLTVGGTPRTATTDATGRAQFSDLRPGSPVKASATVGDERLESQEFPVPANGGVRVLLVATDPNAVARRDEDQRLAAAPAQAGSVVFGDESRFVFEFGDGSISVFNILQVLNTARTPVELPGPLIFELPTGATGASVLQASSKQATAVNGRIVVAGPFAPGPTLVQFGYSMPYSSATLSFDQSMPAPLGRVIVLAQKSGEMRLSSPQMTEQRDMTAEGNAYIVGQGPAVPAGSPISFQFSGLPHEPRWPRFTALALAVLILAAGAWAAWRPVRGSAKDGAMSRLEARRAQLFAELTTIEQQHRDGQIDAARYARRRAELVSALERIYAELDRQAA